MLELDDIQGIVFSGYAKKHFAEYLLLRVDDGARARDARDWLRQLLPSITTGVDRPQTLCLNIALTASGLKALGLEADALQTLPLEFREGMAGSDTRARALGDTEQSAPEHWLWGDANHPVHMLLALYADSAEVLREAATQQLTAAAGILSVVYTRNTYMLPERREHFGFADGISQPTIAGGPGADAHSLLATKAGEFILGYENAYDKQPFSPSARASLDRGKHLTPDTATDQRVALGRNGTYLVVRQLEQDVAGFWRFMRQAANAGRAGEVPAAISYEAIALASKCVGRWPSGAPLVAAPDQDDPALESENAFGYFWRDRQGARCPIGAHIRRTNPRDSLEPDPISSLKVVDRRRILRRGRSYGAPLTKPWEQPESDGQERGLFFMCLNANIRRQFEFIQQTWVNNPKFAGLYEELDPLIGNPPAQRGIFTIPAKPTRKRLQGLSAFVTTRGGEYFFLPGIKALRFISELA